MSVPHNLFSFPRLFGGGLFCLAQLASGVPGAALVLEGSGILS